MCEVRAIPLFHLDVQDVQNVGIRMLLSVGGYHQVGTPIEDNTDFQDSDSPNRPAILSLYYMVALAVQM